MKALILSFVSLFIYSTVAIAASSSWPQFRGPDGSGHSDARTLPLTWSETDQVKWKTPIHDRGWSSPVVQDNQIWLTTASEDGRQLFAICVDLQSGKIVHDLKLFEVEKPQFAHKFNTYASPSPVIDGQRVYVTFGSPGTACLNAKTGKVLWERRDFVCNHFRGAGSSPIVFRDLLIMNFDGSDHQFVVALDKHSGKTVWKVDRSIDYKDLGPDGKPEAEGDWRKAFSTPHIANVSGKPVLFSSGAKAHYAYEPLTGKELWRIEERSCHSAATRPVFADGLLLIPTGFSKGILLAIRPGALQEHSVLDASKDSPIPSSPSGPQIAWKVKRNVACKPSVVVHNGLVFMIDDGGIATCLDAASGQEIWRERVGGNFSASPIVANDRVYFFNEEGKATVIQAAREFKILAENQLADGFMASPAVAGNALILRTKSHLYRIDP